ncbi:MAG TPA: hypothetical protein VF756_29585 [Thermoanaerobaculia bacterium]
MPRSLNCKLVNTDGVYLVTASADRTARLWEAVDGRELARMQPCR